MKKILYAILIICILTIFLMFTSKEKEVSINKYFMVSYNGEELGLIESEDSLLNYIEDKQNEIKKKFSVDNVHVPNGLQIQKVMTYDKNIKKNDEIYNKIIDKSNFTIEGYRVFIKIDNTKKIINVTRQDILEEAIKNIINLYVGEENYEKYLNNTQEEIKTLGTYIESVYIENEITLKKDNISIDEKIYSDSSELTQHLLYGTDGYSKKYVTSIGDTINSIAMKNQISEEEFLMGNPQISNASSLLYPGQEVTISVTNPQIQVVVEQRVSAEKELNYKSVETVDENRLIGDDEIIRQGENGILKVINNEKIVNGTSVYVQQVSSEVIKPAIDKIMIKGGKKVSGVGSLTDWAWPVDHVYITSRFGWRIHPITHERHLHSAVDFASGYGAPIYAANNGVITQKGTAGTCGYTVVINHNNGYHTVYCHMSRYANITKGQIVEKGQLIGYIGMTGQTTGPHLHFGLWKDRPWNGTPIDPLTMYR